MTDTKLTDSITTSTTQLDLEGKTGKQETDTTSLSAAKSHLIIPKSEIVDKITEPNEKNGHKRIQRAPVDGASKKPRINTPEHSSAETKQAEQEMVLKTKQADQEMVLQEKADQEMVLIEQPVQEMVLTEPPVQEMAHNIEQADQEMVATERPVQEMVVKTEQVDQEMVLTTEQTEQEMVLTTEQTEREMVLTTEQTEQAIVPKTEQVDQEMALRMEQTEQKKVLKTEQVDQEMALKTEQTEQEKVLKTEQVDQEMVLKTEQTEQKMVLKTKESEDFKDRLSEPEEYHLTIQNLPTDWTYVQIKNYLDQECGHIEEMEILKHRTSKTSAIRLTFQSIGKCTEVFNKLENKHVQDKKLNVKISDTYTTFPTGVTIPSTNHESLIKQFSISNEVIAATRWRPDLDCWDTDPEGLYGLRPEFLRALNIKPPINKMVHVTNFRCDKAELREVMELAGNVLMCSVVTVVSKYAKVMYSHPLEAVQAISMLNGQLFYGTPLKITIDRNPADSIVLPKGLANIGQGLGIKARPIRNIAQQYHRYAKKQTSSINPLIFSEIDFTNEQNIFKTIVNAKEIEGKIKDFFSSRPGCNVLNPTVKVDNIEDLECPEPETSDKSMPKTTVVTKTKRFRRKHGAGSSQDPNKKRSEIQKSKSPQQQPPLRAPTPNPLVRLGNPSGGLIPPNMLMNPAIPMPLGVPREPFFRPDNNLHQQDPRPFRPRVPFMAPPMQRPPFPQPRPSFGPPGMRPQIPPNFSGTRPNLAQPVTVKFLNLPPSTTYPLLCDQLAKCGQVMSVQLTTPGCAVATFGHPLHADRCFKTFNGKNVDGYVIEVIYI